jgi:CBS domain-containing protein
MRRITLFLFGGVADLEDEPPSPKAEFLMAIAGPAASVVLTGVFAVGFTLAVDNSSSELLQALLSYLASINLIVAVFNMLPGYPLDGGRVLRSALWAFKKDIVWATRIASTIGQGFGFLLILLGLFSIARGQPGSGLWSSLLGFLLLSLARASYVQVLVKQTLHGKPAEDFMNTEPSIVHPETTITHLMQLALNQPDANLTPVIHPDGRFLGCADLKEARKIPEKEWSSHFVHEIIQPCRKETSIAPDTDAEKALTQMAQTGTGELLVIRDGHLLGVLTRSALLRYLSFRRT